MIGQTTTNFTAQPSKMVLWIFSLPFGFARGNVHRRARMRQIHWKNVHPHLQMALRNMQMDNYYNHSTKLNYLYMHSKCIYSALRLQHTLPGLFLVCPWGRVREFQYALGQVYRPHWSTQATCAAPLEPSARTTPPSDLWSSSKHIAPLVVNQHHDVNQKSDIPSSANTVFPVKTLFPMVMRPGEKWGLSSLFSLQSLINRSAGLMQSLHAL